MSRFHLFQRFAIGLAVGVLLFAVAGRADESGAAAFSSSTLDQILDANVRDGMVYYRALRASRAPLDHYVASLADVSLSAASRNEQMAFWLNAYNAIVLEMVTDHYPITSSTTQFPARSIKQIPGAFDRATHRVAGQSVTLDQIEQTMLTSFHDPRLFLALGRGAMGGGRLRSEAYVADRLDEQLAEMANECADRNQCLQIVHADNRLRVSSIFSWRRAEFVDRYAGQSPDAFAKRAPIERAIVAFIAPTLLDGEKQFLAQNAFKVEFVPFDWSLNDLTGKTGGQAK